MAFDVEKAFRDIANGNQAAFEFLLTLFVWFHQLDDLIDRDKPVDVRMVMATHIDLIMMLSSNPFFLEHCQQYYPLFLTGLAAFIDSEKFKERPAVLDRIASQILKSEYQEIFFYTAYLTGGFKHMLDMTTAYRQFDFDPVPPPGA